MIKKFGKSLKDVLFLKDNFIWENQKCIDASKNIAEAYLKQPVRKNCKLCGLPLNSDIYFKSHGVDYKLCDTCSHVNGSHEDTLDFCKEAYLPDSESALSYICLDETSFLRRMHSIYEPKAKFLLDSLNLINEDTYSLKYLDYGAGCGFMTGALRTLGLDAYGIDVSSSEVDNGNKMLKANYLTKIELEDTLPEIENTNADVISFISVLEHVYDLRGVLAAIRANKNIKYVYFCVPLFSLVCILEIVNQNYYNRHLGAEHTHLFTKDSLEWMYKEYGFEPVAVWDFGSELMDLRRFTALELINQGASEKLVDYVLDYFKEFGDEIQLAIDRSGFASETHVVIKNSNALKRRN